MRAAATEASPAPAPAAAPAAAATAHNITDTPTEHSSNMQRRPGPARRTLFHRLERREWAEMSAAEDLTLALTAIVQQARGGAEQRSAAQPVDSVLPASALSASVAGVSTAAASAGSASTASAHLFALLAAYPLQANRICRYLELDSSSAMWTAIGQRSISRSAISKVQTPSEGESSK